MVWIERVIAEPDIVEDDEFDPELQHRLGKVPVSLAQRLWESIEYGLADAEEKSVIAEVVRRNDELTAGFVVGREHGEVMRAARQRLGCA